MHIIYTGATPIPAARVQRVDRVGALEDSLKRLVLQVSPEYLPSILILQRRESDVGFPDLSLVRKLSMESECSEYL